MDQNNIFIKNSLDTKKENKTLNNKYEEFFEEISTRLIKFRGGTMVLRRDGTMLVRNHTPPPPRYSKLKN